MNSANTRDGLDLETALTDAECLLHYAAQAGIEVSTDVTSPILAAQQLKNGDQSDPLLITAFLNAYAKLSSKLAPVTAETVRASNERIGSPVKNSGVWAIATLVIVVLLSLLVSVTNTIGKDITDGITKANALAATARYHVGAPKIGNDADWQCGEAKAAPDPAIEYRAPFTELDLITELQTFAASIRDIHSSALKWPLTRLRNQKVAK